MATGNSQIKNGAVEIETSVSKAFMARELGVEFDRTYYFDPYRRRKIPRPLTVRRQSRQITK